MIRKAGRMVRPSGTRRAPSTVVPREFFWWEVLVLWAALVASPLLPMLPMVVSR